MFDLLSSVRLLLDDTTLKQKLGLSSVSILSLLLLSRTKFMKQCQEIEQNWKGRENFYMFLHFNSGRETGYYDLRPPIVEIFPIFPNFLRSNFLSLLSRSRTRDATRIPFFCTRHQLRLSCGLETLLSNECF